MGLRMFEFVCSCYIACMASFKFNMDCFSTVLVGSVMWAILYGMACLGKE